MEENQLMLNGLAVSEEEYDKYYELHPTQLPELVVTPKKGTSHFDALFGFLTFDRLKAMNRAMYKNPNFMDDNWLILQNVGDVINMNSGGFSNRLSLSQNVRFIYDMLTGKSFSESWFGNSGIVTDKFAEEHPWLSATINGIFDYGTSVGFPKFIKYGNERIPYDNGAESIVYKKRLFPSNSVIKISNIPLEEMSYRNRAGKGLIVPSRYLGRTPDGRYIYELSAVRTSRLTDINKLKNNLNKSRIYPIELNGELVFVNPRSNTFITDLSGNISSDGLLFDGGFLTYPEFLSLYMKRGGKLIKNNNYVKTS